MFNTISFVNFKNNLKSNFNNLKPQNNFRFFPKNNNLAPLAHDTVSFSGAQQKLNKSLYEAYDNIAVCCEVRDNAKPAMMNLKNVLETSLEDFIADKKHPNRAIDSIHTRIKTADSIKEKTIDRLNTAILSPQPWAFNPNTVKGIKGAVRDIVGARIILRHSDQKQINEITDALVQAIEDGKLKITKIENYDPVDMDPKLKYFKEENLKKLQVAANKTKSADMPEVQVINNTKSTGYMALHLDVDLSDPDYKVKNNGYSGEIQIVGYDIAQLKDIEDFCYKMKSDKDIKSGHYAYKPLSEHFRKLYRDNPDYPNLEENYEKYTAEAYLIQRKKEPIEGNKKRKYSLPSIEECGFQDKIPKGLDFNTLESIKNCCDKIYDFTNPQ